MRYFIPFLLLISCLQGCRLRYELEVFELGIFEAKDIERTVSDVTITGFELESNNVKVIYETHVVYIADLRDNEFLAFNYAIEKLRGNRYQSFDKIIYDIVIKTPPIISPEGERRLEQKDTVFGLSGLQTYYGYLFSEKWERVAGIWSFEFFADGISIGVVHFDVREGSSKDLEVGLTLENLDVKPTYKGGIPALSKYLEKSITYPIEALKLGVEGDVVIGFIIDEEGDISDCKVVKSLHKSIDAEALRVISMMPNWNPGEKDGKAAKTVHSLPVSFRMI